MTYELLQLIRKPDRDWNTIECATAPPMMMLQLIRKPDRDWNRIECDDGSVDVIGYNSLENPIGIETKPPFYWLLIPWILLQLIRKPDRDWNFFLIFFSPLCYSYNSLENPIGIETITACYVVWRQFVTTH